MSLEQLRRIYDVYQRQQESAQSTECDAQDHLVRIFIPALNLGFVTYSKLTSDNADEAIAQSIAYFQPKQCDIEWTYFDYDTPDDLPSHLVTHGFQATEPEAVMVLDIAQAHPRLHAPLSFDVRQATTQAHLHDADTVENAVWGDIPRQSVSARIQSMWENDPSSASLHIAYVNEKPVCYGRLEFGNDDNPFASIWSGATLPGYRGQGLYTSIVSSRLQEAQERGRRYLTVDAKPDTSMPILEKLGFITIAYSTPYFRAFK
jgi:GNAT superfamily N-acetyltransferase